MACKPLIMEGLKLGYTMLKRKGREIQIEQPESI
jgi:hypothetical protein